MASDNISGTLTTGQLARTAGVSSDTIRHYEKLGLLAHPGRSEGGYRLFPAATLRRVEMIRSALSAGFSLAELATIFSERDSNGAPCRKVAKLGAEKVAVLDRQIVTLIVLRDWLAGTVTAWDERLKMLPDDARGHLLELLPKPDELHALLTKGTDHEDFSHRIPALAPHRRNAASDGLSNARQPSKTR
jgi:DNA-binding transcriptional MerR regulator